MRAKIIGIADVNFKDQSGREVSGTSIYAAFADENVNGLKAEKFFVNNSIELPKDLKANDTVEMSFNYKGKIDSITKA